MKYLKTIILLTVLLVVVTASANTNIGFTNGTASRSTTFRPSTGTDQRLAMRLSHEKLQVLKGKTISSLRFAFGTKNSTDNKVTLFLATSLDGEHLRNQTATITSINKFLDFALDEPYTITGEEDALYIGCMMEVGESYKPFSADYSTDPENAFFYYSADGWKDLYGQGVGCPNIQLVIDGDMNFTDAVLEPFEMEPFVKSGTPYSFTLPLLNFGTTTITSVEAQAQVGNGPAKAYTFSNLDIASHQTASLTFEDITTYEEGTQDVKISLTSVNGETTSDQSDDVCTRTNFFYPKDMVKNVLLDVFTGQSCSNCPNGHKAIANAIETSGVEAIEIAHHSGYAQDMFSMTEDFTMTNMYNGSAYAPGACVDRTIYTGTSPVFDPQAVPLSTYLTEASKEKPYVSIALDAQYDETTRMVDLKARFHAYEDIPADELRMSMWLVQDSIIANQTSGGSDYVHNAVSRGCLTESAWGEAIELPVGETVDVEKSFLLPESIASTASSESMIKSGKNIIPTDLKNMKIVVFVGKMGDTVADLHVYNAAEVHIEGDTNGIRDLTPVLSQDEGTTYNVAGQRTSTAIKGLYIKNGKKFIKR